MDEKWVALSNPPTRGQWVDDDEEAETVPRKELHGKKFMLAVYWCSKGVVFHELLPNSASITADIFCAQLDEVDRTLRTSFPQIDKVRLLMDNARPHTAKKSQQKIIELGYELLPHAPYSPDTAPSDYHLFADLTRFLEGKNFDDAKSLKSGLDDYFTSQPASFYRGGIEELPTRWRQVVEGDGAYLSH